MFAKLTPRLISFLFSFICFSSVIQSQNIAINKAGNPGNADAILDMSDASNAHLGLLLPNVSLSSVTDVTTIPSPPDGLIVYNTNSSIGSGFGVGFYYWSATSTQWLFVSNTGAPGVTTFSAGTTGFTPSSATTGAVTLSGILNIANGGSGLGITPTNGQLLIGNGTGYALNTLTPGSGVTITNGSGTITINATGSGGTVTSVGLADGSTSPIYSITNSPITSSGTLTFTLNSQSNNLIFAGPSTTGTGQPTFRALVAADLPTLNQNTTGSAASFTGNLAGDVTGTQSATTVIAIESATTSINVSSATAPATGQVLTATSGTAATWQTPSGGSGNYINNGTSNQTSANFNIQGVATGTITAVLKQLSSQTSDLLDFQNSSSAVLSEFSNAGYLGIGVTTPSNGNLDVENSQSTTAVSIYGANTASSGSGSAIGVSGYTTQSNGYGVYGRNASSGALATGVYGYASSSSTGIGVLGNVTAAGSFGVEGTNGVSGGYALYGNNTTGNTGKGLLVTGTSTLNGTLQIGAPSGAAFPLTANTGSLTLYNSASTQGVIIIPNNTTATFTLTLPASVGSANQALVINSLAGNNATMGWATAGTGTVTNVTATAPLASSGGTTPNITLGGTTNGVVYATGANTSAVTNASTAANQVLMTTSSGGAPTFQAIGALNKVAVLTSSGTYSITAGTTSMVVVLVGGGGGGGGCNSSEGIGGGGGGGAYCQAYITSTAATYAYSVGGAGTAGAVGSSGSAGGNTTFGTSLYTANGGSGGVGTSSNQDHNFALGGAGGAASGGIVNIPGSAGGPGVGTNSSVTLGGAGGGSIFGVGPPGLVSVSGGTTGTTATILGTGGAGAASNSNTGKTGGAGAAGTIIVYEYK